MYKQLLSRIDEHGEKIKNNINEIKNFKDIKPEVIQYRKSEKVILQQQPENGQEQKFFIANIIQEKCKQIMKRMEEIILVSNKQKAQEKNDNKIQEKNTQNIIQERNRQFFSILQKSEKELATQKKINASLQEKLGDISRQFEDAKLKFQELDSEIQNANQRNKMLVQQRNDIEENFNKMKTFFLTQQNKMIGLKAEVSRLKSEIEKNKLEERIFQKQGKSKSAELQKYQQEKVLLNISLIEAKNSLKLSNQKLEKQILKIQKLEEQIKKSKEDIQIENNLNLEIKKQNKKIFGQRQIFETQLLGMRKQLSQKQKQMKKQKNELLYKIELEKNEKSNLTKYKEEFQGLKKQLLKVKQQNLFQQVHFEGQIKKKEEEKNLVISKLIDENANRKKQIDNLQKEVNQSKSKQSQNSEEKKEEISSQKSDKKRVPTPEEFSSSEDRDLKQSPQQSSQSDPKQSEKHKQKQRQIEGEADSSTKNNPASDLIKTNKKLAQLYKHSKIDFKKISEYIFHIHGIALKWKKMSKIERDKIINCIIPHKFTTKLKYVVQKFEKKQYKEFIEITKNLIDDMSNFTNILENLVESEICKNNGIIPIIRIKDRNEAKKFFNRQKSKDKKTYSEGEERKSSQKEIIDFYPYDYDPILNKHIFEQCDTPEVRSQSNLKLNQFSDISSIKNDSHISEWANSRSELYHFVDKQKSGFKQQNTEKLYRKKFTDCEKLSEKSFYNLKKEYKQKNQQNLKLFKDNMNLNDKVKYIQKKQKQSNHRIEKMIRQFNETVKTIIQNGPSIDRISRKSRSLSPSRKQSTPDVLNDGYYNEEVLSQGQEIIQVLKRTQSLKEFQCILLEEQFDKKKQRITQLEKQISDFKEKINQINSTLLIKERIIEEVDSKNMRDFTSFMRKVKANDCKSMFMKKRNSVQQISSREVNDSKIQITRQNKGTSTEQQEKDKTQETKLNSTINELSFMLVQKEQIISQLSKELSKMSKQAEELKNSTKKKRKYIYIEN